MRQSRIAATGAEVKDMPKELNFDHITELSVE